MIWKILYVVIALFLFAAGVVTGMLWGTYSAIDHLGQAGMGILSGTTIHINLNETKMAEEINKTVVPSMKSTIEKYLETKK